MLKQGVKNYFGCLKYVFTPLGVIALGVIIGLSVLIPGTIDAIKTMCNEIFQVSSVSIDFKKFFNDFVDAVRTLDWSDVETSLGTVFTKEWWIEVFDENFRTVINDFEAYIGQISLAIESCINKILIYAILLIVFTAVGFIVGIFLTRWIIRREIAKRAFWKLFVSAFVDSVLSVAYIALAAWLMTVWEYSIIISVTIGFVLSAVASLTSAYLVHGFKKIKFSKIVNIKNAAALLLTDLAIFAIGLAIVIMITLISNAIVGVFVALGILTVTVSVMLLEAEAYVKQTAACATEATNIEQMSEAAATDENG